MARRAINEVLLAEGPPVVAVCADPAKDHDLLKAAARLAVDTGLPFIEKPVKGGYDMLLVITPQQVELRVLTGDSQTRGGKPLAVDFSGLDVTSRAGRSIHQPLAKAVGIRSAGGQRPTVIDATAGWGQDAWLLAALGCPVLSIERHQVLATLLRDGLLRAGLVQPQMLGRVTLLHADSKHLLRRITRIHEPRVEERIEEIPDALRGFLEPAVVYLDPMFPVAAGGRKAAEGKPLRVLRRLVGDDDDAVELFDWAMRVARQRVVVKRPAKAPLIVEDPKPTTKFTGKGFRFDVYSVKRK